MSPPPAISWAKHPSDATAPEASVEIKKKMVEVILDINMVTHFFFLS